MKNKKENNKSKSKMTLETLATITKKTLVNIDKLAIATQKGFEEMEKKFMTREEMKEEFMTRKEMKEEFMTRNELLDHFDHIYGALNDLKNENAIGAHQYRKHELKLEDHEKRIKRIEEEEVKIK